MTLTKNWGLGTISRGWQSNSDKNWMDGWMDWALVGVLQRQVTGKQHLRPLKRCNALKRSLWTGGLVAYANICLQMPLQEKKLGEIFLHGHLALSMDREPLSGSSNWPDPDCDKHHVSPGWIVPAHHSGEQVLANPSSAHMCVCVCMDRHQVLPDTPPLWLFPIHKLSFCCIHGQMFRFVSLQ